MAECLLFQDSFRLGANPYATSLMAFVFSTVSILLILALCTVRSFSPNVVVLSGMAIGSVWTAATTILQFYATDVGLSAAVIWNFGDLGRATYRTDGIMFVVVALGFVFFLLMSWRYNALLSGEATAKTMGIHVEGLRFLSLLLASVITAVCVSFLGIIGFVGIICPHVTKRLLGQDHRVTIPVSCMSGSLLLWLKHPLRNAAFFGRLRFWNLAILLGMWYSNIIEEGYVMCKQDVIEFFDRCAPTWDAEMIKNDEIIGKILDNAEIGEGCDILDVACGTGVLFPHYLQRGAASVTGIDISPEMAKIAAGKFGSEPKVQVICGDVEEAAFDRKFDRIVVYNAFPHFPNPKHLIKTLAGLLKEDGRMTIAHGASRETIDSHHSGSASKVSNGLMSAEELVKLFDPHFTVEVMISNKRMYQVSGVKRDPLAHSHFGVTHTHGGLTHTHTHGDEAHEHTPEENATPIQELLVLMRYLVSHNDAHAQEVADLAAQLQSAGKYVAYDEIMDAVSDFDMVNAKLDAILSQLTVEEF